MKKNEDNNGQQPQIILQPDLMPISLKEYARRTNQPLATVQSQAEKNQIPTLTLNNGRIRYVNQLKMFAACAEAAGWDVRFLSSEYFL